MKITDEFVKLVEMAISDLKAPFKARFVSWRIRREYDIDVSPQVVGKALAVLAERGRVERVERKKKTTRWRRIA